MRSAFVIATFALTILAAPVPEANPIFKGKGDECVKRIGGKCAIHSRDSESINKMSNEAQFADITTSTKNARSPYIRPKTAQPELESTAETDIEARFAEPNILEKNGLGRNKNSRSIENDEQEEGAEAYDVTEKEVQSASPYTRNGGGHKRDDQTSSSKRTAEAEPVNRINGQSGGSRHIGHRNADPEPFTRNHGSYRTRGAEPGPVPEAEPIYKSNGRSVEDMVVTRSPALSRPKNPGPHATNTETEVSEANGIEARAVRNEGRPHGPKHRGGRSTSTERNA